MPVRLRIGSELALINLIGSISEPVKIDMTENSIEFVWAYIVLSTWRIVIGSYESATTLSSNLGRSSRDPKYEIEFLTEDSRFTPDDDQESVLMPSKKGQNYLCFLPKIEKVKTRKPVIQPNTSSVIMESDKRVNLKTPDELLEALKGPCFVRQEGWWSYEFCYNKRIRQVHLEDDKLVEEYILGVYDAEATSAFNQIHSDTSTLKDPRSRDSSQRYHAHIYTNGTICDLTKEPRTTEVRFVCSEPRTMISSITELSTCKYALTFHSPLLCKHPLFQEEKPVSHTIFCNLLPKDYRKDIQKNTDAEKSEVEKIEMVTETENPTISGSEK
ncbi:protein OS-9 homolog [Rutidosis leptorrhynchoides]|uniref:protein OS-9 homolog n=1 Tax=Rutidosis leptorrhynchoides TaxID=125765 RepID=UPI003A99E8CB